jgi:hypothetical protein
MLIHKRSLEITYRADPRSGSALPAFGQEKKHASEMSANEPDPARRRRIRRGRVSGELRKWLAERELVGPDRVRAELALALAAEIDDPDAPRYARPRCAAELRLVLAELDGTAEEIRDHRELARELLTGVLR